MTQSNASSTRPVAAAPTNADSEDAPPAPGTDPQRWLDAHPDKRATWFLTHPDDQAKWLQRHDADHTEPVGH